MKSKSLKIGRQDWGAGTGEEILAACRIMTELRACCFPDGVNKTYITQKEISKIANALVNALFYINARRYFQYLMERIKMDDKQALLNKGK